MSNDKIIKKTVLQAPRERVWRAISDSEEFGKWFGITFDGPFEAGKTLRGVIVPTKVDSDVAKEQKPYEGHPVEFKIEKIEPQRLLSFRWHPFAVDPNLDYSAEPMTLIEFQLEDTPEGVRLTVTESGFDKVPPERRAKAFSANEGGWTMVMSLIEKHLAAAE